MGSGSTAGPVVNAETAMRVTSVWRSISLVSGTISTAPLMLYRRVGNGKERAIKHPLYRVVCRRPNGWMTRLEFWRLLMTWLLQHGNSYAFIQRDGRGRVVALLPVHPSLVRVYRAFDGTPIYEFSIWYGTERFRVTGDNMFHLRWGAVNPYLGMSPIAVHAEAIGDAIAARQFGSQFFANGAAMSGVLSVPGQLGEDAQRRIAAQWAVNYSGPANAHRTAVLANGAKYERIGIPPNEAQWLELRGFQVEDIGRIYGVPPHLLGATTKSTSWGTGIEQMTLGFIKFTLNEHFANIAQSCDRDLLLEDDDDEYFFEHDISNLERGDLKSLLEAMSKGFSCAAVNPNEIRERIGLNPYADGEKFFYPVNTAPNSDLAAAGAAGMSVSDIAAAVAEILLPHLQD
ncbi:phage portal protein [Azospirillum tabaci]|uniref:phage portal protein n=1 Tax=Azospirillum tabaci TaxID=2752310 RepID=UPI002483FF5A|nr:phage portal protein [Azospirillum tabaci]